MPSRKPKSGSSASGGVLSLKTSQDVGLGSAFQVVSQASAAAVLDGSQYLQAVSVVSATALAKLTEGMVVQVAGGSGPNSPDKYQDGMEAVQKNMKDTADTFEHIGTCAAAVLQSFQKL